MEVTTHLHLMPMIDTNCVELCLHSAHALMAWYLVKHSDYFIYRITRHAYFHNILHLHIFGTNFRSWKQSCYKILI